MGDGNPIHQKYKAKQNTSRHNPKKKQKANNQHKKKTGKDPKKGLPSLLRVGSWSVAGKTVAITYCPCYLPTTIRRRDFEWPLYKEKRDIILDFPLFFEKLSGL
jgi:hypothetical protein